MDKIVIITGGTRGIGFATAKKFLEKGDKVVIASIDNEKTIENSIRTLSEMGEVSFISCNVISAKDCENVINETVKKYGKIDILVNVAGIVGKRDDFLNIDLNDTLNVIQVNLMGTINMCHFASKIMAENKVLELNYNSFFC